MLVSKTVTVQTKVLFFPLHFPVFTLSSITGVLLLGFKTLNIMKSVLFSLTIPSGVPAEALVCDRDRAERCTGFAEGAAAGATRARASQNSPLNCISSNTAGGRNIFLGQFLFGKISNESVSSYFTLHLKLSVDISLSISAS